MMKKTLRSLCAVAAACCSALTGFGGLVDVDGFGLSWDVGQDLTIDNKRYAVITGVTGSAGGTSLTIPASIQDYESGTSIPVREIGYRAFYDCKGLKELHVPDSVRVIGDEAFSGCKQLATLDLGQGVTSIGRNAFWYCPIGEINIPDSLIVPPNRLFDYCTAVTNLTIGSGLKVITTGILPSDGYSPCPTLATVTIRGNGETEIAANVFTRTKVRFVTLEGVASIANSAFKDCPNLSQVTFIGNSLTNIGEQAFAYCPSLQGFSIPDSVRTLGIEVFRESGLEAVSLGAGVTNVPDRAFLNCRALTTVALPAQVKVLGSSAFENCTGLETIDLGTGVETLGGNVFYGCSQLGDVTVPEQVTSYGRSVFAGCSGLTNMTIAANVDVINNDLVVPYTGALETLTIRGSGSTVITEGTLSCMANLRHVTIGGVAEIQNSRSYVRGAFELCEKLESVTFEGNSLTNIGDYAFEDCKKLTSLVFPDSVQRIAGFPGCSGLKTLEFGSGLVQLGSIRSCLPQAVRFAGGVPSGLSNSSFTDSGRPDALAMIVYAHDHAAEWEEWLDPFLAPGSYSKLPDTVRYVEEPAAGGEVISGSVTWSTDRVHVVNGWMTLAEGATLTIAPGAIVKFRPGTGIYIRNGARCDARGALLTHIADDEVGGDTDGVEGVPVVGEYNIVPFGEYLTDDATFDRYRVKKLQVLAVRAYPRWPWNSYVDLEADIWSNDPANTMKFRLSRPDGTEDRSLYSSTLKAGTNGYACVKVAGSADYNYIGKIAAYRVSANGRSGSTATTDILLDLAPVHYVVGSVELPYSTEWDKAGSVTVKAGDDVLVEKTAPASGTVVWTPEMPGTVVLRHIATSEETATFCRLAAGTALHRGVISNDTCWAANQIHVVNGRIDILGDAQLTIEPGAVVKFTDGSSIVVAAGSACEVKGVIFTHVADATVGGDTLEDGGATAPVAESYSLVGNVIDDASTEYRYGAPQALTGPLTADRVLYAGVYKVQETVTIQKDVTLTLEPGTILKFDTGCGLCVSGTLSAKGTRASPIVFTSLKDDAFGGDTDGDRGRNKPAKGDWATISVKGGKADFDYVRILYGGNDGTGTSDQLYLDGNGRVSFRNSSMEHVFKYCAGLESGVWTMENSFFRDFYTAFRHFASCTCVNSVFYDCTYLSNNGGQVFKNCIIAKYSDGISWKGSCSFRNCCFYDFGAGTVQRPEACGINGNFWGDPLFSDAENGDFRLMAGSPCIDAAEGALAPARDHFGSPRMNTLREDKPGTPDGDGMYPDIGIFEAVGVSAEPMPDLAILSVTAPSAIQPGTDMTVCYTVTNRGAAVVSGVIRDTVRLRGAEAALGGQVVTLDTIGVSYSLEAGAAGEFRATVKLPILASGKWTVGVQVNTERDVIESTYANNSLWAEADTDADLPPLAPGVTETTVAQAGKAYYSLAGFAEAGVVIKVTGGNDLAITAGGRMAVQVSPGVYFVEVPTFGADERRSMTVENLGYSTTVKIETADDEFAIWSVSPDRVANSGEASVLVTGSGFASNLTFKVDGVDAAKVEMTGPMQALVTFDATRFAPGYPSITAIAGEKSVKLDRAFEVYRPLTGPKLNCWVEKPAAVRDGRIAVAYLCCANEGDSPMRMPVFAIICSDDQFPDTKIGISPDAVTDRWIALCGISATAPAGVLKAGESVRLPFYLLPKDGYCLDITRYDTPEMGEDSWFEACAENATRLNLRGRTVYDYKPTVFDFSELKRNYADNTNSPYAAASGYLLDPITREALSGRNVALVDGTGGNYQAVTDENGYFQVTCVPDGTYHWEVGLTETLSDRSTNEVVIAGQADLNNCEVFATAAGRISGHVTGVNGMVLPGCLVILFDSYGTVAGSSEVDVCGRFQIDGLKDGAYTIRAQATGGYLQQRPVPVTIDSVHRREEIEFSLTEKGATLRGSVSVAADSSFDAVTNGAVQAITAAGQRYEALVDEHGEFLLEGLEDNRYCVRYYSGTMFSSNVWVTVAQGSDVTLALVANDRPLFEPTQSMGFGSCVTEFVFIDPERAKNVTSWAWDFDSDGTPDSTAARPTHTYSALGTNTVTLTFVENGETKTSVYRNCVIVEQMRETVYAANAIVFGKTDSGTLAVESISDGRMVLTGEPGAIPLVVGTVLNGPFDGEYFCSRVRSVEASGGRYTLAVDPAGWDDLYEQVTMAGVYSPSKSSAKAPVLKSAPRLFGAEDDDDAPMFQLGLNGSFWATPSISHNVEFVYTKVNGRRYLKWAILGNLSVRYSATIEGSAAANVEKKIPFMPKVKAIYPNGLSTEFEFNLRMSANASISGNLSITGTSSMMMRYGQEGYDGNYEWLPPVEFSHTADCSGDIKGTFTAMASIEPTFKLKAFEVMSAEAALKLYAKINAEAAASAPPSCAFSAGVDVDLGMNLVDIECGFFSYKVGTSTTLEGPSVKLLSWTGATPDFITDPEGGAEPDSSITFYNTSLPGTISVFGRKSEAPINAFEWEFGDGTTRRTTNYGDSPTHAYAKEGYYCARLRAVGPLASPYKKGLRLSIRKREDPPPPPPPPGPPYEPNFGPASGGTQKSCDPNELVGPLGVGERRYVKPGEWLTYTIFFENKAGFDIADAQEVFVTNALSAYLDWSTFEMGEVAFGANVDLGLDGRHCGTSEAPYNKTTRKVRTKVRVDEKTGIVDWYLRIVDPDGLFNWPEDGSGFLPSNDETHRGEAHLTYRIRVRDDAPGDVQIDNAATIVFDMNDPITTDPSWWNTVGSDMPATGEYVSLDLVDDLGVKIASDVDYAAGDKVTVKVEGLAKGLKVVATPVYDDPDAKKKVIVGYTYTIEGVPTETVDFDTQAMYARVSVTYKDKTKTADGTGKAESLQPVGLSVVPQEPSVLTAGVLNEVYAPVDIAALWPKVADAKANPKEWSFKGWPAGIKYNATTKDASWSYKGSDGKSEKAIAVPYTVYGQPTKAGEFPITATHKYKLADGKTMVSETFSAVLTVWGDDGATDFRYTDQAYAATETKTLDATFKSFIGLPSGIKYTTKLVAADAKKGTPEYPAFSLYGTPTKPGVFAVTATMADLDDPSGRKTVKKTFLWKVAPPEAPTFALDTGTAPIAETKAQIVQGANQAFAIATSEGAKVTASGLPTGLKLVQDKTTKHYSVEGVATKPGDYRVTFKTVLNGVTTTSVVAFTVKGNPFEGTYCGYSVARPAAGVAYRLAVSEVMVAAAGTVKFAYTEGKTKYTASVKSFDWDDATGKATAEGLVLKVSSADKKLGYGDRKATVTFEDFGAYFQARLDIADADGTSVARGSELYATVKTTEVPLPASQTFVFQSEDVEDNMNALATVSLAYDAKKATAAFSGKLYDGTAVKATVPVIRVYDEGTSDDYIFAPFLVVAKDGTVYCFDNITSDRGGVDWVDETGEDTDYVRSDSADYTLGDKKFAELVPEAGTFTFGWGSDAEAVGAPTESFAFEVTTDKNGNPAGVAIYDADPQEGEKALATVTAKMGKTTGAISVSFTSKKGDKAKYAVELVWRGEKLFAGHVTRTWKGLDPKTNKSVGKTAYGTVEVK